MSAHDEAVKPVGLRSGLGILLAFAYLVIRFGLTRHLDALGEYGSYIFESFCVIAAAALYGKRIATSFGHYRSLVWKPAVVGSVVGLLAGFAIFKSAGIAGIGIPFDLQGTETLLFLLIVAPILEESIFRFFLWEPIQILTKKPLVAWLLTSLIFSYSHFHAIWFVPPEIHPFIWYQTAYTLVLGLACGFFVFRYRSLVGAVLIHFAFNLGFYLAS